MKTLTKYKTKKFFARRSRLALKETPHGVRFALSVIY